MQTIKVELEDSMYQDMLKSGINVQDELNKLLKKIIYHKEHKIANDVTVGIEDIKKGKTRPIQALFNEL